MADEQPSLRLKPRLKPDEPAAASPAPGDPSGGQGAAPAGGGGASPAAPAPTFKLRPKAPAPAEPTAAGSVPAPDAIASPPEKMRLKPKLAAEPPKAAADLSGSQIGPLDGSGEIPAAASTPPPPPPPAPAPAATEAPAGAPKIGGFKLKPKSAEPVAATLPVVAPAAATGSKPPIPPADLVPTPAEIGAPDVTPEDAQKKLKMASHPAPKVPTNAPIPVAPLPAAPGRRGRNKMVIIMPVLSVLLLGGAAAGYFILSKSEPPPPPVAVRKAQPKAPAPQAQTPSGVQPAGQPGGTAGGPPASVVQGGTGAQSTYGKAVQKAANVANGAGTGIAGSDGLLDSNTQAPGRAPTVGTAGTSRPGTITRAGQQPAAAPPGGQAVAPVGTGDGTAVVAASPAFRKWVNDAKIPSVIEARQKALINGKNLDAGMVADDVLGIVFERIEGGTIFFKDKTGATASRRL